MRITIPVLLFLSLLLGSCSTDITLEGPWEDIPVVYGFLSVQDTAHYIRVEKAFLEPGGNAEEIARIPDSLYYGADEATVILEKVSTGQRFTLSRVIGEDEGYPRQSGIFATTPNILYKIKASQVNLSGGQRVRIIVERPNKESAVAETVILSPIMITQPISTRPFGVVPYNSSSNVVWEAPSQAGLFDVRAVIRYRESIPGSTTQFVDKTVDWAFDDSVIRNPATSNQDINFSSVSFFLLLASELEANPQIIRRFSAIDFYVTGAGTELADFITISNANTGITSAEQAPVFNNVTNGLGLLSSRYRAESLNIMLNENTRDSLRNGIYTKLLNFVP